MAQIATCHHCGRLWLNGAREQIGGGYGVCYGGTVSSECQQAHTDAVPPGKRAHSSSMYITCHKPPKLRVLYGDVTLMVDREYRARMHALAKIFHANSQK